MDFVHFVTERSLLDFFWRMLHKIGRLNYEIRVIAVIFPRICYSWSHQLEVGIRVPYVRRVTLLEIKGIKIN